ncbi:MAG: hypothetical protein JWN03_2537 [Nocardia sp.]|uniref:AfsR/SARP family transcriptional regulator n=1 Tax=Nocardia sp. TaxID=1821 RepID=UPI002633A56B|nr:BTAD domain-containing putative transcriptional regulator [Nocardia sp.]MCU1642262.1 hypothetical protein [Nocardia sp.]
MRVGILGPLEVLVEGEGVEIGGVRLRGLLIRLALDAGRPVSLVTLVAALWPDDPPRRPGHAVQTLVSRLRRVLPVAVRFDPGGYRLELPPDAVDAHRFERLLSTARRESDPARALRLLREASALWRGPALADVADLPFAAAAAARWEELRLTALEDAAAIELESGGDLSAVVAGLAELTAAQPLRERPREMLIRALHRDGRRGEALAAYERYRVLLAEGWGGDPGTATQAAHLRVLRDGITDSDTAAEQVAAPLHTGGVEARASRYGQPESIPPQRNALSAPRVSLAGLIGREQELAQIADRLGVARLVTLVGPGGTGKTRLAMTIAQSVTGYPGGVGVAELAAVTDPGDLVPEVGASLGIVEPRQHGLTTGARIGLLAGAMSTAPTLLVLDNCEHLVDAVARFAEELLGRCPALHILATSREPLDISGEMLCDIAPLPVPAPGAPPATALAAPAVRLFADRAVAVRTGFAVNAENIDAVADICRALDGLPLALELAAAKLRTMPLAALHAGLGDRFAVLTNGRRTALPRHRTLRAVLDWDWELLCDEERRALARLAVFPSSFGPDAAQRLGASTGTLDTLLDKSLLQLADNPRPRYRMLETIAAGHARVSAGNAAHCPGGSRRGGQILCRGLARRGRTARPADGRRGQPEHRAAVPRGGGTRGRGGSARRGTCASGRGRCAKSRNRRADSRIGCTSGCTAAKRPL